MVIRTVVKFVGINDITNGLQKIKIKFVKETRKNGKLGKSIIKVNEVQNPQGKHI